MRDVVIVGAGAMGCLFAARLTEGGAHVTLVDIDETRLAALRREGISLSDDQGKRRIPIKAGLAQDVGGPTDLVMLFTKSMHSAAAIRSVAHLAATGACALTLQNGLGNAEAIAEIFHRERIVIGVTDFPADLVGPTAIASHGQGQVRLGGFAEEAQLRAAPIAALFNRSNLWAEVDPDIRVAVWEKVAFNAALNAMATVTGLTVGGLDAPPGRRVATAIVAEVVATAAARGIGLDRARIDGKVDFALRNHRGHKPSMLQDRLAGRPTEIEAINGAVVRAAAAAGAAAPVTAALADLVRLIDRS